MINLWYDLRTVIRDNLKLVHLTAEPVSVGELAELAFNRKFDNRLSNPPASYDFKTRYGKAFGGDGDYQYNRRESIQAIRAYAQSEPRT